MSLRHIVPLFVVAAVAGLVGLFAGCTEVNRNPVINSLTATPDSVVRPGDVVVLAVSATDADGDALTFTWSATAGTLSASTGESVLWTAPAAAVTCTVTVICNDGQGGKDTRSKTVSSRAWFDFNMDGYTSDSVYLNNPGTTEAIFYFELDDEFPAGSIVDSVFVTTDFEPIDELELEQFNVWVVSPSGTTALIYDGFNLTELNVDDRKISTFNGELAPGTWKLRVERPTMGVEGYLDECALTVFYRY